MKLCQACSYSIVMRFAVKHDSHFIKTELNFVILHFILCSPHSVESIN